MKLEKLLDFLCTKKTDKFEITECSWAGLNVLKKEKKKLLKIMEMLNS